MERQAGGVDPDDGDVRRVVLAEHGRLALVPSWSLTDTELAPSTTWAAVTMCPWSSTKKPVPVAVASEPCGAPPNGDADAPGRWLNRDVDHTGRRARVEGTGVQPGGRGAPRGGRRGRGALDDRRRAAVELAGRREDARARAAAEQRARRRAGPRAAAGGAAAHARAARRGEGAAGVRRARRRGPRRPSTAAADRTRASARRESCLRACAPTANGALASPERFLGGASVAEPLLDDLAHRVAGQLVEEADLARALVRRELAGHVVDQLALRRPRRRPRRTTQATIRSPRSGSGSPVTAASSTPGCSSSATSISPAPTL